MLFRSVQPGQEKKQAVGYLDDGTMVVVDDSRDAVGRTVDVELTRVLQTAAGRMMFARRIGVKQTPDSGQKTKPTQQTAHKTAVPRTPRVTRPNPRQNNRSRQSRRTPEDTLVDLAND